MSASAGLCRYLRRAKVCDWVDTLIHSEVPGQSLSFPQSSCSHCLLGLHALLPASVLSVLWHKWNMKRGAKLSRCSCSVPKPIALLRLISLCSYILYPWSTLDGNCSHLLLYFFSRAVFYLWWESD